MRSFRAHLRGSALILITALLLTFNTLVYWGFHRLLQEYVDGRLLGLAQTLAALIEQRPELLQAADHEIVSRQGSHADDERMHELREASHTIQVLDRAGKVVWSGMDVVSRPPLNTSVLAKSVAGEIVYETLETASGTPVRRVSVPVREGSDVRYLLLAEASLGFARRSLKGLMGLLILVSVVMIALAWFVTGWLVHTVLRPIQALSRTAGRISESSLRDRVNLDVSHAEFHLLAQAFNAMLDRLQKASESQRRFVDHAAHEMKTPLTVMQGALEVSLQKSRTADEYREVLVSNLEQVQRLIGLTRSLLTLARFAGDRPPVQLVPLALEPLLQELVEDLTPVAEDREVCLVLEREPVPPVLGDAERLQQLFINLLDNALRYTDRGGTVTVRLSRSDDRVHVAVRDTGQGIAPEFLPHLFERFYRTDPARARDSGGTGLGLPIVKEIAEAHHGSVRVESEVGKGSVFTFTLPAAQP